MFKFNYVIGRGSYGKVWRVEKTKTKEEFALKQMIKAKIMSKKSVQSVMDELKVLNQISDPFIVNMHYAFQERGILFLVLDLMPGGDLRYHMIRQKTFTETQAKFMIACIIQAFSAVHKLSVIHRDLKPENLVFDSKGYLHLTDFGIACSWTPDNHSNTSGTPCYMAPEVLCRQNHGIAVDYYALGVIAFELMNGYRPYSGRSRKEVRDQILAKQVKAKPKVGWSQEAVEFINYCLARKPVNRIGFTEGSLEAFNHKWFKDYPWEMLRSKKLQAPFIPDASKDCFDLSHVNKPDQDDTQAIADNEKMLKQQHIQTLFQGYYFNKDSTKNKGIGSPDQQSKELMSSVGQDNTTGKDVETDSPNCI